jgi:hypothetical protein
MNGRRAIIGLMLLCALVVSAFAAPNATALRGTTAYTCKPEPKPTEFTFGFEDEHCDKAILGTKAKWVHEEIKPGTTTKVTATNNETGGANSVPGLRFTSEGEVVEILAAGFSTCKEKTTLKNSVFGEKEQMIASGEFCGEFTSLEVTSPSKECKVKGGIIQLNAAADWRSLVLVVGGKEEMSFTVSQPTGKPFTTFELEKCPNKNLNKSYSVEGTTVQANVSTEVNSFIGATIKFETKKTGEALKVGGAKAEFSGIFTPRMVPEFKAESNPIALETTEK